MDNSQQPVGKQWHWYTPTSGIWQTVYIEPRHRTHIRVFRIIGDMDAGSARFEIQCAEANENCLVEVMIGHPHSRAQNAVLEVRDGVAQGDIKLTSLRLWDPNQPELYPVTFRLRSNGQLLDQVHTCFGMRKVDFEFERDSGAPTALRINGAARYLRGALYQAYFADGVYTATSLETFKKDILCAKQYGFNFLRIHIKVEDPLFLYWADTLGIFLMADFPNFGEGGDTVLGRRRFEQMMRETIERDFNHPSIVAWCLFNETWGFGGQDTFADRLLGPPAPGETATSSRLRGEPSPEFLRPQEWVQKMWELAKRLDPTRLVEDMSVCHWEHLEYYLHCDTDINSWHFYINDYEKAKDHINKVVGSTFLGSSFNYVPGFLHKGQPLINSEYGGIGALDGDRDVSWSFKFLTNELRRHQQIAAYIFTELHDVEWEHNGFLNYDRTAKEFGYDPSIINESNALPIDSPPVQRVAPGATIRLRVDSAHFSTRKYDRVILTWQMGGVDTAGRVHQDLGRGSVRIPFPHRKVALAHLIEIQSPHEPMLCTLWITARTEDGATVAQNFVHYHISVSYPPQREETNRGLLLRGTPSGWARAEWSEGASGREQARADDACYGGGHGFFEWLLPMQGADISRVRRLKLVCEVSSHRADHPQTDDQLFPTTLQMFVNDIRLYEGVIHNHPHDSHGVLSYLRGSVGAYGYLVHAFADNELLNQIVSSGSADFLSLRCAVPADAMAQGGLTIYGAECGRYPVTPTILLEW